MPQTNQLGTRRVRLCADGCQVMKDSVSFYRDAHHLSVAGAMAVEDELASGLGFAPAKRGGMAQIAAALKQ